MRTVNKHVAGAATPHGDMKPSKVTVVVLMLCVMFVTLSGCDSPGKLGPLERNPVAAPVPRLTTRPMGDWVTEHHGRARS